MNILPKMTVKALGGNPAKAKANNEKTPLVRIYGVASGLIGKTDSRGEPITGLTGEFEGVNLETGEVYRSGVLYLPGGIQELVESAVNSGELDEKKKPIYNSVKFGFDISSVPAGNPAGYSYEATALIKASENDPMAEMRDSLPALPKPKTEAKASTKKTAEKTA